MSTSLVDIEQLLAHARDRNLPVAERMIALTGALDRCDEFFATRESDEFIDGWLKETQEHIDLLFEKELRPLLVESGIVLRRPEDLSAPQRAFVHAHMIEQVLPALTPLAMDFGCQLPRFGKRSLGVAVVIERRVGRSFRRHHDELLAIVPVPRLLRRLVVVPSEQGHEFVLLEQLVAEHAERLFAGHRVQQVAFFRVTRSLSGAARRLELDAAAPALIEEKLCAVVPGALLCRRNAPLQLQDISRLSDRQRLPARRKDPTPFSIASVG